MKINKKLFLFLLPLLFFIPKNTFALEIGGVALPGVTTTISSGQSSYTWYPPHFGAFSNWGPGYLRFDFSISTNNQTSSTSPFAFSRGVIASVDNVPYICEVGSPSVNNSTYVATTYSAVCPMNMTNGGIGSIEFKFGSLGTNVESSYTLSLTGVFSYEQAPQTQVNIDMSSLNNSIQQQITNDNTNTDKIVESNKQTQEEIKKQTEEQKKTNDTLTDATTDDPSSDISAMNGKIATNNSISQLLTLPIQLYQNILNSVSGSCSSFSLGSLFNHSLTFPCINLKSLLGSTLFNIIDILISGLFILSFRKKIVDIFNHMTSLNDRGNELE